MKKKYRKKRLIKRDRKEGEMRWIKGDKKEANKKREKRGDSGE